MILRRWVLQHSLRRERPVYFYFQVQQAWVSMSNFLCIICYQTMLNVLDASFDFQLVQWIQDGACKDKFCYIVHVKFPCCNTHIYVTFWEYSLNDFCRKSKWSKCFLYLLSCLYLVVVNTATAFHSKKPWNQVLCSFKSYLRCIKALQWWETLTVFLAGNKT